MTQLSQDQKRALKAKAHHLNPIVMIGQKGLTDSVLAEIDLALFDHELIKIKSNCGNKLAAESQALEIQEKLRAAFIARIGKVLIFYKRSTKSNNTQR